MNMLNISLNNPAYFMIFVAYCLFGYRMLESIKWQK